MKEKKKWVVITGHPPLFAALPASVKFRINLYSWKTLKILEKKTKKVWKKIKILEKPIQYEKWDSYSTKLQGAKLPRPKTGTWK